MPAFPTSSDVKFTVSSTACIKGINETLKSSAERGTEMYTYTYAITECVNAVHVTCVQLEKSKY